MVVTEAAEVASVEADKQELAKVLQQENSEKLPELYILVLVEAEAEEKDLQATAARAEVAMAQMVQTLVEMELLIQAEAAVVVKAGLLELVALELLSFETLDRRCLSWQKQWP